MGLMRFREKGNKDNLGFLHSQSLHKCQCHLDTGKTRKEHGGGRVESRSAGGEIKRSV